jgi:hypothetical protein
MNARKTKMLFIYLAFKVTKTIPNFFWIEGTLTITCSSNSFSFSPSSLTHIFAYFWLPHQQMGSMAWNFVRIGDKKIFGNKPCTPPPLPPFLYNFHYVDFFCKKQKIIIKNHKSIVKPPFFIIFRKII